MKILLIIAILMLIVIFTSKESFTNLDYDIKHNCWNDANCTLYGDCCQIKQVQNVRRYTPIKNIVKKIKQIFPCYVSVRIKNIDLIETCIAKKDGKCPYTSKIKPGKCGQ